MGKRGPVPATVFPTERRCNICKVVKPIDAYNNDRSRNDGKARRCRECCKPLAKLNRKPIPLEKRRGYRLAKYGLTEADYDEMVIAQKGACAICFKAQSGCLYVDHSHRSGFVRGLLCLRCNFAIGNLDDSQLTILNAVKYLMLAELAELRSNVKTDRACA